MDGLCLKFKMNNLFKPPQEFDFDKPETWKDWLQRFERFRTCSNLSEEGGELQVASLLYSMGDKAEKVFSQLTLTAAEKKQYATVVTKLNAYFLPKINVIHERSRFYQRDQLQGESVEAYVRALHELASRTQFANTEEAIRDRIVLGVRDKDLSRKLQLQHDLDYRKAVDMARQQELVEKQIKDQRGGTTSMNVDAMTSAAKSSSAPASKSRHGGARPRHSNGRGGRGGNSASYKHGHKQTSACGRCGKLHGPAKEQCPAYGKQCYGCDGYHHFKEFCRSKTKKQGVNGLRVDESDAEYRSVQSFFLGSLGEDGETAPWQIDLQVNGVKIPFKIDTGADISVIPMDVYRKMNPRPKLAEMKGKLESPGGEVKNEGQFVAKTKYRGTDHFFRVVVIRGTHVPLLSRGASLKLGLVKRVDEAKVKDCAFGEIGTPVECEPIEISLKEDADPYSISGPRRVPIPLIPKVGAELERMEKAGVIQKITEPTEWCAGMVPVLKKNGDVRICVDLKNLNRSVKREKYEIPTLEDVTHKLAGAKTFTKLDATSGFWQIPLSEKTAKLTTFLTPFGRYFFKRLPFGISLAPEIFQRTMEKILEGIDGVVCFMDDVVVCGDTDEQHDARLKQVLDRVIQAGLKLNREKCEFNQKDLIFLGHKFGPNGIEPDKAKVEAIQNMPEPENETELRRFLGMVNYLGRFVPNLSQIMHPLNALLNKDAVWLWGHEQREAVKKLKESLTSSPTLVYFEMNRETAVAADASSYGMGGVLYQKHDGEWKPVAYCSRTLTSAERRYAQIEKELLAAVHACTKFERYLVGLPEFKLYTDHRPLVPLLNKKDLVDTPIRCQRMIMRMMRFNANAEYTPGKNLVVADALSRSPLIGREDEARELETDIKVHVDAIRATWPVTDAKLAEYAQATNADATLQEALRYIRTEWPLKSKVTSPVSELYDVKDELSESNGLLLRGDRIVIPESLRKETLAKIHDGHFGIEKCRERARSCVWWPGMSTNIKTMIQKCEFCAEKAVRQPKEPLVEKETPDYPFQIVAADLCEKKGEQYLIVADEYSRYIEICRLRNITSASVIKGLKEIFARHGIPMELTSDNGTQFDCGMFEEFAREWGMMQVSSSPRHAQGNGAAERAVKTAKHILDQEQWELALLTYRATPIAGIGLSPAELLFGRKIRTRLPCIEKLYSPKQGDEDFKARDEAARLKQKLNFDRHYGARPLPVLTPGDTVRVMTDPTKPDWVQQGTVIEKHHDRSYIVNTPSGQLRRNRVHIKKVNPAVNRQLALDSQPEAPEILPDTDTSQPQAAPTSVVQTRCGRTINRPERYND